MKKSLIAIVALSVACVAEAVMYEGVNIPQLPERYVGKKVNPKSPMAKIIAKAKAEGGYLRGRVMTGNVVRIINKQKTVSSEPIEAMVEDVFKLLHFAPEIVTEDPQDGRTAVSICMEDRDDGLTLLVAPENRTVSVNVRALNVDNPQVDVLNARVRKELWRSLVYVMGGGNSQDGQDVMRVILNPTDLDTSVNFLPSPEPFHAMTMTMDKLNVGRSGYVTYKQACLEGWAPAPKTELERKIWDENIKEGLKAPTNPIKIKFDPESGR